MLGFGALYSYIRRQLGLRTDAASASGSLHSKVADVKSSLTTEITNKSAIKSIQRGTATFTNGDTDVTISAVTLNKSFISMSGGRSSSTSAMDWHARLTSTTNLKITGESTETGQTIAWEVIEYV
jgi:hypothetical protein